MAEISAYGSKFGLIRTAHSKGTVRFDGQGPPKAEQARRELTM